MVEYAYSTTKMNWTFEEIDEKKTHKKFMKKVKTLMNSDTILQELTTLE